MDLKPLLLAVAHLFLYSALSQAQTECVPVFIKEYYGNGQTEAFANHCMAGGETIIAGRVMPSSSNDYDGWIMKIDKTGNPLWSYTLGGDEADALTGICALADGSFLLYGTTSSYGHSSGKVWLVHISDNGVPLWSKQIGTNSTEPDRPKHFIQMSSGAIIGSITLADSTNHSDAGILSITQTGVIQWLRRFNGSAESFTSIAASGNSIFAGGFTYAGTKRAIISELDANTGNLLASKSVYRNDFSLPQDLLNLEVYDDVVSYALAITEVNGTDLMLAQTDLSGQPLYSRRVLVGDKSALRIKRASDNGFYVQRLERGDYGAPSIVKFSRFGLQEWGNLLASMYFDSRSESFDMSSDGGIVATSNFSNYFTGNLNRVNVIKMSAAGKTASCKPGTGGMHSDTGTFQSTTFNWSQHYIYTAELDQTVSVTNVNYAISVDILCDSLICTNRTPLPAGCNKTSRIEYSSEKPLVFTDMITTTDGGRMAIGSSDLDAVITKLNQNGDVIWSKMYNQFNHQMRFRRMMRSSDGNIYIFGYHSVTVNHGSTGHTVLIKMDNDGNVIWSKNIYDHDWNYRWEIADIFVLPDDGFILLVNSGYGMGATYSFVMRYDHEAHVVWKKQLTHFAAAPVYKSVYCSDNAVYLAYDSYDYSNYNKFGVDKISLISGQKIWTNRYASSENDVNRVNRIFAINDTAYVFLHHFIPVGMFNSINNIMMVKINPDGELERANRLITGNNVQTEGYDYLEEHSPSVTMTLNNEFVMANRTKDGVIQALNITKFTTNGTAIWSRNYSGLQNYSVYNIHTQADGIMIAGTVNAPIPFNNQFTKAFILKVDSSGLLEFNATGNCGQSPANYSTQQAEASLSWNAIDDVIPFNLVEISVPFITQLINVDADLFCRKPMNCTSVTIEKFGVGCSMNDTLTYYLKNASNCDAVATWRVDKESFKIFKISGDTIKVVPTKPGPSVLKVILEGNCFLEERTINTSILVPASEIELGDDIVLCPGTSIPLKAPPGYASYKWNNGTNDSVVSINMPGTYFVEVVDNCGGTGSDTVEVFPANKALQLTKDTSKCNADTIVLTAAQGYANYSWSPSGNIKAEGNVAVVSPSSTQRYFLEADIWSGCRVKDSVLVTVLRSPEIITKGPLTFCEGDSVLLDAGTGFLNYSWNTGATEQSIYATHNGQYSIAALYNNGCISKGVFLLNMMANPIPYLSGNSVICGGTPRILATSERYSSYLWNNGSTMPSISVESTGKYSVTVMDSNGCEGKDSIELTTIKLPPANFLSATSEICQYGKLKIIPIGTFESYLWNDQSTSSSLTITQPGRYWLKVSDEFNCTGVDSIDVIQKQCLEGLYAANAFTPNGDGKNDVFRPVLLGNASNYRFTVFNRWGAKVFETNEVEKSWDGKIKGFACETGTYVWQCAYQMQGQPKKIEKGFIELIR